MKYLTIFALVLSVLAMDDSPMWRSDIYRTGTMSEVIIPDVNAISSTWSKALTGIAISTPVVVNGRVYVGSTDGNLYCRSEKDGSSVWTFPVGSTINSSVAYDKGRIYFNARSGKLYCLHALDPNQLFWTFDHGGDSASSPLVKSGLVFFAVGSPYNMVKAVDAVTGKLAWQYGTAQLSLSSPTWADNKIIIGDNSGLWICLDAFTGEYKWSYKTASTGVRMASCAVWQNVAAICTGEGSRDLYFLDTNTGALLKSPLVKVWSPGYKKPGSDDGPDSQTFDPTTVFPYQELQSFLATDKATRDAELDARGKAHGIEQWKIDRVKEYLDDQIGDVPKKLSKSYLNSSNLVVTSSPAFVNGKVLIVHREQGGTGSDQFFGACIDYATNAVTWGTVPYTMSTPEEGIVPSPSVSAGQYVYLPIADKIEVRNLSDGNLLHTINVGSTILGGVTIANGRIFVTTQSAQLLCFPSTNNPPSEPTTMNPSGGISLTDTFKPTIIWSGQGDPDNDQIQSEIQISLNDADVEINGVTTILPIGQSSYTFVDPLANGTTVYYRIRVRDIRSGVPSAYSIYTSIQNFIINKDVFAPDPVSNLTAAPFDAKVRLSWTSSPSPDVAKYRIYYKLGTTQWSDAYLMDNVSSSPTIVTGLVNFNTYDFMVTASDGFGNESQGVVVSSMPIPEVSLNGVAYNSIQEALNAAVAGQTVLIGIRETPFYTNLVVRPGVSLIGYSPKHSKIVGSITITPSGLEKPNEPPPGASTIANLSISGGTVGVSVIDSIGFVKNCVIHHVAGNGVSANSKAELLVVNCTVADNAQDGINSSTTKTTVRNTLVSKNKGKGIASAGGSITYNNSVGNSLDNYPTGISGLGNISLIVEFIDADYLEDSASPGVDAGDPEDDYANEPQPNGSRINQGAYGNSLNAAKTPKKDVLPDEPSSGSSSKFCYVATALLAGTKGNTIAVTHYGELKLSDKAAADIDRLCSFRDDFLKTNPIGSLATTSYYEAAPQLSEKVSKSPMVGIGGVLLALPLSLASLSFSFKLSLALLLMIIIISGITLRLKRITNER